MKTIIAIIAIIAIMVVLFSLQVYTVQAAELLVQASEEPHPLMSYAEQGKKITIYLAGGDVVITPGAYQEGKPEYFLMQIGETLFRVYGDGRIERQNWELLESDRPISGSFTLPSFGGSLLPFTGSLTPN